LLISTNKIKHFRSFRHQSTAITARQFNSISY